MKGSLDRGGPGKTSQHTDGKTGGTRGLGRGGRKNPEKKTKGGNGENVQKKNRVL